MSRFVTRPAVLALSLATMLAACDDHGVTLAGPEHPLAVGAYHGLTFGEACSAAAGGKGFTFCNTQGMTTVLGSRSDDPTVAEVVLAKDHPQAARANHPYYVLGKGAGRTSLVFKGLFDDGSVRESRIDLRVAAPDTFKMATTCGTPSSSTNLLVNVGDGGDFSLEMFAGSDQLEGWLPGAVTADGLSDDFADLDTNSYAWLAPATPVVLPLRSSMVAKVDGTLTAIGLEQVTEIDLKALNELSAPAFLQPGNFDVATEARVHGQAPCHGQTVELHSSTPAICSGPVGEAVWPGDNGLQGHAVVHGEGNCVLGAGTLSGPVLNTRTFPIFFVQPPPVGLGTPALDAPCPVEGGTACASGYAEVGVCQAGRWMLKGACPAQQICDYVPDATPGCVAGISCAQCRGLR